MTGGNAFIKIYPFLPYTGECCPCPSHNPSASIRATRTSCSENLRTWGDADKTAQCTFAGRGDAVYVEGLFPSTTVGGDQIIWGWSEDGETYARTNTYTIFSLRMFGDLNFDNIIDSIDYAAASSLTEHGWVMPVASNTLRKVELKTDLLIPGHLILSLTGDAQLRVWTTATPAANDTPLLITGQSITNGVDGASFGAYPVSTLYIEAISSGTATLTYSYVGTGNAEGFGYQAQLNLTAVKVELSLMWEMTNKANQVFNFTKKDDLPGCFSNKLYVVTDSSDNKYHVMVKANIEPSVLQSDFRCAVYKNDSKVSGSDKPFNSDGEVQLEFFDLCRMLQRLILL
ncbi:MAG: hypothetical protein PHY48_13095 [Candidatus Cloacimonetes bacterium]|nr:hypothetical protein [Candidatus Cloacimonadota bacterium]